jgi:hypothetical protein
MFIRISHEFRLCMEKLCSISGGLQGGSGLFHQMVVNSFMPAEQALNFWMSAGQPAIIPRF